MEDNLKYGECVHHNNLASCNICNGTSECNKAVFRIMEAESLHLEGYKKGELPPLFGKTKWYKKSHRPKYSVDKDITHCSVSVLLYSPELDIYSI